MSDMDFTVSAGHDEHPLEMRTDEMVEVWPRGDDALSEWMNDGERMLDWFEDRPLFEAKWVTHTGLPVEAIPDADLTWESIYRVQATRERVTEAFEQLLESLCYYPSGDDDTFDYWPSGIRLVLAVGAQLGEEHHRLAVDTLRPYVLDSGWAAELLDKTGLRQEGDPE